MESLKKQLGQGFNPMNWKKSKQKRGEGNNDNSKTVKKEPLGLVVLHPTPEVEDKYEPLVDIIAVHGLGGTAKGTWTDGKSFWLEDFLPKSIPNSRIMTFGYNSNFVFSASKAGIDAFARQLLNCLRLRRLNTHIQSTGRPLIFIAHSLGGIVVKKALIMANEGTANYGDILNSTTTILFMGTPHRGSEVPRRASPLTNIVKVATLSQGIRRDLLAVLKTNSDDLIAIAHQFVDRANSLTIRSFVEMLKDPLLRVLIVPPYSAIMDHPKEIVCDLDAHHRSICRYPSEEGNYCFVEEVIRELVPAGASVAEATHGMQETLPSPSNSGSTLMLDAAVHGPALPALPLSMTSGSATLRGSLSAPSTSLANNRSSSQTSVALTKQERDISGNSSTTDSPKSLTIRISGLKKVISAENQHTFSYVMTVSPETPLEELGQLLLQEQPDLKYWKSFQFPGYGGEISDTWKDVFTSTVEVTSGKACYQESRGPLKIHEDQTIAFFCSKVFPHPIAAWRFRAPGTSEDDNPITSVAAGKSEDPELLISFMRTLRIPEDGKTYKLPPRLGMFPIFDIRPYGSRLPPTMVLQGGLFIPMYQMEAMSMNFECLRGKKFAVRPFFGGVNGVSGETPMGKVDIAHRPIKQELPTQDYVVLPKQQWLHGIATEPGIVKQFVATKMTTLNNEMPHRSNLTSEAQPSSSQARDKEGISDSKKKPPGNTIEWQVTGRDYVGGIQLQIIPRFKRADIFAGSKQNIIRASNYDGDEDSDDEYDWRPSRDEQYWLSSFATLPSQMSHKRRSKRTDGTPESTYEEPKLKEYDVLKSPSELRLQPGDLIHVKDMTTRQQERPKVVRDLLVEGPKRMSPTDVIELEIFFDEPRTWKFNVQIKIGSPDLSLKVDEHDKFTDICDLIQKKSEVQQGSLHMMGMVRNKLGYAMPVHDWDLFLYLRGIALSMPVPRDGEEKVPNLGAWPTEWDFVWQDITEMFCTIRSGGGRPSQQSVPGMKELIFAMEPKSTILDLRREVEHATGVSMVPYSFNRGRSATVLNDDEEVFSTENEVRRHNFPSFSIWYDRARVSKGFQLFLKNLTGTTLTFQCNPTITVEEFKEKVRDREGWPVEQQRLIFAGTQIEDGPRLTWYGIAKEATIHLVLRLKGGGDNLIVIYQGRSASMLIHENEKIISVKERLEKRYRVPPVRQVLLWEGHVLRDDENIIPYLGKILQLDVKPIKHPGHLGIGAGGSIKQHIERDENENRRVWDVSNSKLLNVQILDAASFEFVTGRPAPQTPVSAQLYAELDFSPSSMWQDKTEEAGIAAEWKRLMGEEAGEKQDHGETDGVEDESSLFGEDGGDVTDAELGEELADDSSIELLDADDSLPEFKSIAEKFEYGRHRRRQGSQEDIHRS